MNQSRNVVISKYDIFRNFARISFNLYRKYGLDNDLEEAWNWQLAWSHVLRINNIVDFDASKKPCVGRWLEGGQRK